MTRVGASRACVCADLTMFVVVLVTLLGAHTTHLFTHHQIFFGNFRVSLHKPGSLQADVGAIAVKLDATGEQGDIFFVEAGRFALFAGQGTFNQFL